MHKEPTRQPPLSEALIEALECILLYLWDAERLDYLAACETDARASRHHIFLKLEVIRRWLGQAEEDYGRG